MDYSTIFAQYYSAYRAEATTPPITDDEYIIGIRFANDAIRRWSNYDNTMWKELSTDTSLNTTGAVLTTTSGTATYACPTAMTAPGGYVKLLDATGAIQTHVPVVNPEDVQFLSQSAVGAYFTGDANHGFTLRFIKAPTVTGQTIFYPFYKTPTLITVGADKPDMSNADFVVNHMLANRFRASRNPYYATAKRDAENMLAQMKMQNDSGTWSTPWKIPDRSGTVWGENTGNGWRF